MAQESRGRVVSQVLALLGQKYGPPAAGKRLPPLDQLILELLMDGAGPGPAQQSLAALQRESCDWNEIRVASAREISELMPGVGAAAERKADAIKIVIGRIFERHDCCDLEFIRELAPEDAARLLLAIEGVEPRHVAGVFHWSLGLNLLPADSGVERLLKRLGLIEGSVLAKSIPRVLAKLLSNRRLFAGYRLLQRHAEETCREKEPDCDRCLVLKLCRWGSFGRHRLARAEALAREAARAAKAAKRKAAAKKKGKVKPKAAKKAKPKKKAGKAGKPKPAKKAKKAKKKARKLKK